MSNSETENKSSSSNPLFDEEKYESDRLSQDAKAMNAMKEKASAEFASLRTPWKWEIRKHIWDLLEERNLARPPRPVHHRIPNFDGAQEAADRLTQLEEFQRAHCIKVNPDTPQRPVRHHILAMSKTLLTPQPRLRTGFFSLLHMNYDKIVSSAKNIDVSDCTNSKGVAQYGTPVKLNDTSFTVDLVVVGSTAVCPKTGARVGKGEGFAELEWGILTQQGNLNAQTTLVVTTVHDEQVLDDFWSFTKNITGDKNETSSSSLLTKHDVPVDIIVTPTRTIHVPNRLPKPHGVFWDLLSPQKLAQIRVLQQLKFDIEQRTGEILPSGPDEVLPPTASRGRKQQKNQQQQQSKRRRKRNNSRNIV